MVTSVGDLLDAIHFRAWALSAQLGDPAALLAAWPVVARAADRAVGAVPVPSGDHLGTAGLHNALIQVTAHARRWTDRSEAPPDARLLEIADRYGALADLLPGRTTATSDAGQADAFGLRANVTAPLYAIGTWSLTTLADVPDAAAARWLLRRVTGEAEAAVLVPTADRAGPLDDLAVASTSDVSVAAHVTRWLPATLDALASPNRVSGAMLQLAAQDAFILTAAAAVALRVSTDVAGGDFHDVDAAVDAIRVAQAAWKDLAYWPSNLHLAGVRPDSLEASRDLRRAIEDTFRQDRQWASTEAIARRVPLDSLPSLIRRGLQACETLASALRQTLTQLVYGRRRLWIAAATASSRDPVHLEAQRRRQWIPLPLGDETGGRLVETASQAARAATAARELVAPTLPDQASTGPPSQLEVRLERRRIVAQLSPPNASHSRQGTRFMPSPGAGQERRTPPGSTSGMSPAIGR